MNYLTERFAARCGIDMDAFTKASEAADYAAGAGTVGLGAAGAYGAGRAATAASPALAGYSQMLNDVTDSSIRDRQVKKEMDSIKAGRTAGGAGVNDSVMRDVERNVRGRSSLPHMEATDLEKARRRGALTSANLSNFLASKGGKRTAMGIGGLAAGGIGLAGINALRD